MKHIIISLSLLVSSGCITHRHYHIPEGKQIPQTQEEAQERTNRIWGTTNLIPIGIRPIPRSARIGYRCRTGKITGEKCDKFFIGD